MSPGIRERLAWRRATVIGARCASVSARTLRLDVPGWSGHLAGQHVDLRLTAEDGYQATRSYSLSSGPEEGAEITVERVDDGEVSPFLVDAVEIADTFEVRGPIGGYFVWNPTAADRPLLLIGGGSGIAPLRAIWRAAIGTVPVTVLYSARRRARVIFDDELTTTPSLDVRIHLTREEVEGYVHGHIDAASIADAVGDGAPLVFVCGPTGFVEATASHLVALDLDPHAIRTERFG